MKLADKIIKLRKKFGWSQEELAEKMGVSRQSVSKWEGALSIPDLKKIIRLGEIFGVSTDYLLKDDVAEPEINSKDQEEGVEVVSLADASNFIEKTIKQSRLVAKGVLICIYSVLPLLTLLALSESPDLNIHENVATGVGITFMFLMIASAVVLFISTSHVSRQLNTFKEKILELEYGVESIMKEKMEAFSPIYTRNVSISVSMFVLCAVPLILAGIFDAGDLFLMMMVVLMILLVGLGVYLIIPTSSQYDAYKCLLSEGEFTREAKKKNKKAEKIGAIYWPLVTAIYLGWSLWTMAWGITWIIWPVAGVLFAAIMGLVHYLKPE